MPVCCVTGCSSRSFSKSKDQLEVEKSVGRISFHRFPPDASLSRRWANVVPCDKILNVSKDFVCSLHFSANCLEKLGDRVHVKPNAIPTIFLIQGESQDLYPFPFDRTTVRPSPSERKSKKNEKLLASNVEQLKKNRLSQCVDRFRSKLKKSTDESAPLLSGASSVPNVASVPSNHLNEIPNSQSVHFDSVEDVNDSHNADDPEEHVVHASVEEVQTPRKRKQTSVSEDVIDDTPRKKRLRSALAQCHQRYRAEIKEIKNSFGQKLRNLGRKLKRKLKKEAVLKNVINDLTKKNLLNSEQLSALSSLSDMQLKFLKRQMAKRTKTPLPKGYDVSLKKFALTLHYYSPKAYRYVRRAFDSALPDVSTLYLWYRQVNGEPGFTHESFEILKKMSETSEVAIYGCLMLDEMSIRRRIELVGQKIMGYVDMGTGVDCETGEEAKDALVFMIVGLNGSWKIPVAYFLTASVSGEQKAGLVEQCLYLANDSGVIVKTLTCDGAGSNRTMATKLGCSLINIDEDKFWFPHPATRDKIFFFYDTCHMLKLVRNLLARDLDLKDGEGNRIEWRFIRELHSLQEAEGMHLANKLRKKHILFKNQIMKVKLAAQVLSNSVADALECVKELEIPEFDGVSGTIIFLRVINNLFDVSNSKSFRQRGFKKALCASNFEFIKNFLNETVNYLKNLTISNVSILKTDLKTGILGFIIFSKNVIHLYEELIIKAESPLDFIMTYRWSQDHLEMFFGILRIRGFLNNNPSSREFRASYKKILVQTELRASANGNCIPLENIPILGMSPIKTINVTSSRRRCVQENEEDEENEMLEEEMVKSGTKIIETTVLSEFNKTVSTYVAGVVIRLILKTLQCEECAEVLTIGPVREYDTLIRIKNHGGLITPSADVVKVINSAEQFLQSSLRETVKIKKRKKAKVTLRRRDEENDVYDEIDYDDPDDPGSDGCENDDVIVEKKISFTQSVPQLVSKVMNYFFNGSSCKLFPALDDHFYDCVPLQDHKYLLVKTICQKYIRLRTHYISENINDQTASRRQVWNKLTLFHGG